MRRLFAGLAVLALTGALLTSASAQGGGRRQGGFGMMQGRMGGGLMLLRIPEVQQELKMTQPQISKLQEAQQQLMEQLRAGGGFQPGGDPEAMRQRMEEMQKAQDKAVADILDSKQLARFKQLELQRAGTAALLRNDVAEQLKLTQQQRTQIQQIQQETMRSLMQGFQGADFQNMSQEERQKMFQEMQTKREAAQKDADAKVNALLSESQRAQWKAMLGTPFKFPQQPMGGRGFGGGGFGGGGRGAGNRGGGA
jgi:hypothetical protein